MRDNLEKFISENRPGFDLESPSPHIWAGIENSINGSKVKRKRLWPALKIAAAIVFLLGTGAVIGAYYTQSQNTSSESFAEIFPDFDEMQEYYSQQVNLKISELKKYNYDSSIDKDLQDMDAFMEELKKDLKNVPPGTEGKIVNAIIQNYQTRLEILERVLDRIQSNKQQKQNVEKNEATKI